MNNYAAEYNIGGIELDGLVEFILFEVELMVQWLVSELSKLVELDGVAVDANVVHNLKYVWVDVLDMAEEFLNLLSILLVFEVFGQIVLNLLFDF